MITNSAKPSFGALRVKLRSKSQEAAFKKIQAEFPTTAKFIRLKSDNPYNIIFRVESELHEPVIQSKCYVASIIDCEKVPETPEDKLTQNKVIYA